jgi:hypothetical protein
MNTEKRGLNYAIDYLKAFTPIRLITDVLYRRAGITGKVESLGYSLRREARKPDNTNRVNVSYSPDEQGRDIAYYTYNVDYKPQERPVKAPPVFFWFTLRQCPIASPMYKTIEAMRKDPMWSKGCRIWTGDHSRPILWEGK